MLIPNSPCDLGCDDVYFRLKAQKINHKDIVVIKIKSIYWMSAVYETKNNM